MRGGDVEAAHLLPLPPRTLLLHLRHQHQTVRLSSPWFLPRIHCKKMLPTFQSPAGISLTNLSLAGNN